MTFLGELVSDASGDTVPTPVLLRRMKVLAARLKTIPLADWVERELGGYGNDAPLPTYRGPFPAEARGSFSGPFGSSMNNAPIPSLAFQSQHRKTFEPFSRSNFARASPSLKKSCGSERRRAETFTLPGPLTRSPTRISSGGKVTCSGMREWVSSPLILQSLKDRSGAF